MPICNYNETYVLWDTQDCPLPAGLRVLDLRDNIRSVLRKKGFHGSVSIRPYLSVNDLDDTDDIDTSPDYNGYCIYFAEEEDRDARLWEILVDSLRIHLREHVNLVLILGDISGHTGLLEAIHLLKSRNFNVFLTQPPETEAEASGQLPDTQWLSESLSRGERLIKRTEYLIKQQPQQLSLRNRKGEKLMSQIERWVEESSILPQVLSLGVFLVAYLYLVSSSSLLIDCVLPPILGLGIVCIVAAFSLR